jgi:antirestriction protein ArdC
MKNTTKHERADVYERVTNQIIKAIEDGAGEWLMPWHKLTAANSVSVNAVSRKPYRGVNVLALWATAIEKGYRSSVWATYAQWQQLGAQVRRGEESAFVVFWKFDRSTDVQDASADADERNDRRASILARGYHVFNAEQVDGFLLPPLPELPEVERNEAAERFFAKLGADIRHGGQRAFYSPAHDYIQLPPFALFKETAAYYATLGHECVHWSGARHRLNRDLKGRFGEEAYAAEELVAELGAAFLCAHLGIANEPRSDHAAYVQNWLSVLRNDKRAIFTAASKAQAAVDWLHDRQLKAYSTGSLAEVTV